MLSQRTISLAQQLATEGDADTREELRARLLVTIDVMERSLDALGRGGPVPALDGGPSAITVPEGLTDEQSEHFFGAQVGLDRQVRAFLGLARRVDETDDADLDEVAPALVELRATGNGPLLGVLDTAVRLRREQVAAGLHRLQLSVAVAGGLLLVVGGPALFGSTRRRAQVTTNHLVAASEARFRALVQNSSEVILLLGPDALIRYASPAAERVFGYRLGSRVGTNVLDLLHPDDLPGVLERMSTRFHTAGPKPPVELRVLRGDDSWAEVEIVANNLVDRPRRGWRGAERARPDRAQGGCAGPGLGARVHLRRGGHRQHPRRGGHARRRDRPDEPGGRGPQRLRLRRGRRRRFDMFIAAEERDAVEDVLEELVSGDFPIYNESHWVSRFGQRRLISWTSTCLLDDVGRVAHVVSTGRDVTSTRRAEAERRSAEQRFRAAFDHAPVGLCVTTTGRLLSVNAPMCDLTGRTEEKLLEMSLRDLVHVEDGSVGHDETVALLAGDLPRFSTELRYERPDGSVIWVRAGVSLVRDDDGRPLHLVVQAEDVTERKAAREELVKQAMYDTLTGLPNRTLLVDRFGQATLGSGDQRPSWPCSTSTSTASRP